MTTEKQNLKRPASERPAHERLDRLEETVYFLENTVRDLSDALLGQQGELTALERRLKTLEQRLDALFRLLDGHSPAAGGDERPPHYL